MKNRTLFTLGVVVALAMGAQAQVRTQTRAGQSCWVIQSDEVELAITKLGGHMAPVTFFRASANPVEPYYVSPWQGEKLDYPVPVLAPLRGDFFCLPFGGNAETYQGETHPPHGETAGSGWTLSGAHRTDSTTTLTLTMNTTARAGRVVKQLSLVDGQNVVYSRHRIEGFEGKTSFGHHATLAMPDNEGAFKISHSPIRFGLTNPSQFSNPANGEYQQLAIGARFSSLAAVPSIYQGAADVDCSRLPQKKGYADLLMIFPKNTGGKPAWLTAVRADEGWMWFSLKDPNVQTATVFWLENHGRHRLPWFGRNNCVGLEDVTAFFADGLKPSAEANILSREGIRTAKDIRGSFAVNYLQGVARIPSGYTETARVEFARGVVTFVSPKGHRVTVPIRHEFLKTGSL